MFLETVFCIKDYFHNLLNFNKNIFLLNIKNLDFIIFSNNNNTLELVTSFNVY